MKKTLKQIEKDGNEIKIIDWYFPLNNEDNMDVTISLNGFIFKGLLKAEEDKTQSTKEHKK